MPLEAGRIQEWHLGLIGWPVEHSLSPQLHQAALECLGVKGSYHLLPVPPLPGGRQKLARELERMRTGELHGFNVTIPHKETVIPFLDECTPVALAIGAVNTICSRDGKLVGDNTDAPAFYADLQSQGWEQVNCRAPSALVLGAGGAARAVVYALVREGWQVWINSRTFQKALNVAASYTHFLGNVSAIRGLHEGPDIHVDLIVNTTPVGMWPNIQDCIWPSDLPLPSFSAVYDLVYNPPVTSLVRLARNAGHPAATGLGMLVEQAALAFNAWTGLVPSRTAMTAAALHRLEER